MFFIKNIKFSRKAVLGQIGSIMVLMAIVAFAFCVRMNTFWLPHWKGDQSHYITLAMKLDKLGFEHYSLRGVRLGSIDIDPGAKLQLVYPYLMDDVTKPGELIQAMKAVGIRYYDQQFFHKPPAFPYALMFSHRLFAHANQPYCVVLTNTGEFLSKGKIKAFFEGQFYAAIVPLFFSIGVVICAFFLGTVLFSRRIGLYAAFLMAINPISIMTAQKLWADDMLTFFTVLSLLLFIVAFKKRQNKIAQGVLLVLAGICCGVAILVKQSAGFALVVVFLFSVIAHEKKIWNIKALPRVIANKYVMLFFMAALLVSGFWFIKMYRVAGDPLWIPKNDDVLKTDASGWFRALERRPASWILYLVGGCSLSPLFVFAFGSLHLFFCNVFRALRKREYEYRFIFAWLVILVLYFFMVGIKTKEHRYMLPAYPFVAVLASYGLVRGTGILKKCGRFLGNRIVAEAIIILLLAASAWWSVPLGIQTGIKNQILLRVPF